MLLIISKIVVCINFQSVSNFLVSYFNQLLIVNLFLIDGSCHVDFYFLLLVWIWLLLFLRCRAFGLSEMFATHLIEMNWIDLNEIIAGNKRLNLLLIIQ